MADEADINEYRIRGTVTAEPKIFNEQQNPTHLKVQTAQPFTKAGGEAGSRSVNHRVKCWGAHAAAAAKLREGDRVEITGYYRIEGYEVGEGEDQKTQYDHLCVVDEPDGALKRVS